MDRYQVKLTLIEPMLGTAPLNQQQYEEWVVSKHPELAEVPTAGDDEMETLEELQEKGTTGFHRLDDKPIIYNYMITGFFKAACGSLRRTPGYLSHKVQAYKRIIDGLVFIKPRRIELVLDGHEMGILERPLRGQTAQGERISLARSETVPEGTTLSFVVEVLGEVKEELLREWLDYGERRGLGQWRNAGYGAFTYEMEKLG